MSDDLIGALEGIEPTEAAEAPRMDLDQIQKKLTQPQQVALAVRWCEIQITEQNLISERDQWQVVPWQTATEATWEKLQKLGMIESAPDLRHANKPTELGAEVAREIVGSQGPVAYCKARKEELRKREDDARQKKDSKKKGFVNRAQAAVSDLHSRGVGIPDLHTRLNSGWSLRNSERVQMNELAEVLELAVEGLDAREGSDE